jgi:hypothetical protein
MSVWGAAAVVSDIEEARGACRSHIGTHKACVQFVEGQCACNTHTYVHVHVGISRYTYTHT